MPKCHKIYPNCIWHVPPEWHGLNMDSAPLTNVYWNYTTHIVRVCLTSKSSVNRNLSFTKKSNLQVLFGSKTMASLYDLLCYHSLTSTDPVLEELLAYLPTLFHSHIFDYIAYEHFSDDESVHSIDSSISTFYSVDLTHFSYQLLYLSYFLCNSKIFTTTTGYKIYKRATGRKHPRPRRRAQKPYNSRRRPDAASSSNCSRLSWTVQAGNSRSHCRRLKLVNKL